MIHIIGGSVSHICTATVCMVIGIIIGWPEDSAEMKNHNKSESSVSAIDVINDLLL